MVDKQYQEHFKDIEKQRIIFEKELKTHELLPNIIKKNNEQGKITTIHTKSNNIQIDENDTIEITQDYVIIGTLEKPECIINKAHIIYIT